MAERIKGITVVIGGDTKGLDKALSATNRTIGNTQSELRQVERLLKLDPKNTELLKQKQDLLSKAVEDTGTKLEALKQAKEKADKDMANGTQVNEEQYRKLQREIIKTQTDLDAIKDKADNFNSSAQKMADAVGRIGEKAETVGKKLLPLTGVIVGTGVAGGKMALDFEDAMANINTLLDDSSSLQGYEDQVKKMSNETGKDIDIMASGMYQAISSIGDGDQTAVIFKTMARSAKAGGAEVSDAVSLISAGMKGYNQVNDETAKKISDLAFQTAKLGVTTFPEMAKSMQPLFPLSSALGLSYEELFGIMATGTGVTGNTSEVTTQLKAIMSGLMKPTADMQNLIEKYGYSNATAMIQSKGLVGTLEILQSETGGQSDKLAAMFGSTEALTLATALTGTQFDTLKEKLGSMGESTGATETAYDKLNTKGNTMRETVNKLKNTLLELGQTLISALAPVIESVSKQVEKFTQWFGSLNASQKETIVKVAAVIAAIGPALIIFGKVSQSISGIVGATKNVISVISKLSSTILPALSKALLFIGNNWVVIAIGIIVVAVTALVAGFIYLWKNCEGFRNFWIGLWEKIKAVFNTVIDFIKNNWKGLLLMLVNPFMGAFKLLYDNCGKFREFIDNFVTRIKDFFINAWNSIVSFFTETIPQWIANIVDWFNSLPEKIGYALGRIVGFFIKLGVDAWNWITVELPKIIQGIIQWFATLPERIGQWFTATVAKIAAWGTQAWNTAVAWTSKLINDTVEWFKSLPDRISQWLTNTVEKIKTWGKDAWNTAVAWVSKLVDDVVGWFKDLPDKMLEIGKNIVMGLWEGIIKMKDWLKEKIAGFFNGFVDGIKDSLQIHSPSRLIANEVGAMVPPAIPIGFKMTMPAAIKKVQGLMGIIAQSFTLPKLPVLQSTAMPLPKLQTAALGAVSNSSPDYSGLLDGITAAVQNAVGTHGHSISLDSKVMVSQLTPGVSTTQGDTMGFSVRRP